MALHQSGRHGPRGLSLGLLIKGASSQPYRLVFSSAVAVSRRPSAAAATYGAPFPGARLSLDSTHTHVLLSVMQRCVQRQCDCTVRLLYGYDAHYCLLYIRGTRQKKIAPCDWLVDLSCGQDRQAAYTSLLNMLSHLGPFQQEALINTHLTQGPGSRGLWCQR